MPHPGTGLSVWDNCTRTLLQATALSWWECLPAVSAVLKKHGTPDCVVQWS